MATWVQSIDAKGIFGRFDLYQELQPGVNVIFGRNGTGKTTLLHILANVLNGDFGRFAFLEFDTIRVQLDDGTEIQLKLSVKKNEKIIEPVVSGKAMRPISVAEMKAWAERPRSLDASRVRHLKEMTSVSPFLPTAYFPAFRTMIEAWASLPEDRDAVRIRDEFYQQLSLFEITRRLTGDRREGQTTEFARRLFGDFVPRLNYPSPLEIEVRLAQEIQEALLTVAKTDRELLTEVFLDVFAAISQPTSATKASTPDLLEQIRSASERLEQYPLETKGGAGTNVYTKLKRSLDSVQVSEAPQEVAGVLEIYRKSLETRAEVQEKSFEGIERYLASVNRFLEGKRLVLVGPERPSRQQGVHLRFDDGSQTPLRALSSGERQIVTLIYAATHMSSEKVILIDEPEISLHVDWQRRLLQNMSEQLQDRQIIACTHSPIVAADYGERVKDLQLKPSSHHVPSSEDSIADEAQEEL